MGIWKAKPTILLGTQYPDDKNTEEPHTPNLPTQVPSWPPFFQVYTEGGSGVLNPIPNSVSDSFQPFKLLTSCLWWHLLVYKARWPLKDDNNWELIKDLEHRELCKCSTWLWISKVSEWVQTAKLSPALLATLSVKFKKY